MYMYTFLDEKKIIFLPKSRYCCFALKVSILISENEPFPIMNLYLVSFFYKTK